MKKTLLILSFVLFGAFATTANAQAFEGKGDQQAYLGFGFGGTGNNLYQLYGFQANYYYGVLDFLSVGAQFSATFDGANYFDIKALAQRYYIGPRVNFHFLNLINPSLSVPFDAYAGFTMGVDIWASHVKDKVSGYKATASGANFGVGFVVGGQWNFAEDWGLRFETGTNTSVGIAYRF